MLEDEDGSKEKVKAWKPIPLDGSLGIWSKVKHVA